MRGNGRLSTRLLARTWLSGTTFEIELERPAGFRFEAGQGVRASLDSVEREYTMVCGPDDERLALCVQRVERGALSPVLASLEIGSRLFFSGPHGYLTLQTAGAPAVFVASGTGIAPFVSMARAGVRGFTLLQGARTTAELLYRPVVQAAAGRYAGCISREKPVESDPSWMFSGRVTDFLRERFSPGAFDFYVCGRREMVRDVLGIVDERFQGSRVFFEIFF